MEFIRGIINLRPGHHGCVATIGAFDGVHAGHRAVLGLLKKTAAAMELPATVLTLEPLPREFFNPRTAPARLMSLREKCELLAAFGIERLLCVRFAQRVREMQAEDFIREVFVEKLGLRHIVVGDDIRFGHEQQGDFALLHTLGQEHGFTVERAPTLHLAGERVSSTRIRKALAASDFTLARTLLGRPYTIAGRVVLGRQLGSTGTGFPTANLALHRHRSVLSGVYAAGVRGAGEQRLQGVANVGVRPTIGEQTEALLEVHILDFSGNLYGRRITVDFCCKLREEQRFSSMDELRLQIGRDIETARAWFARHEQPDE